MSPPDYCIISFISREWEMFQRVPHYIALSKQVKIIAVELPLTIFDAIFRPLKVWKQRSKIKNRLRKINDNLSVYTPIAFAPFGLSYRNSFLRNLSRHFIIHGLKKLILNMHIEKYVIIIHAPHLSCLVNSLNPSARVYEVTDEQCTSEEYPNLVKNDRATRILEIEEHKILNKVDIVFATSKKLYERKRLYNRNTYFIPNGVDLEHFLKKMDKNVSDISAIPRPRIGCVGHINIFLDFEWMDYCASHHPEWSFVFLGIYDNEKMLRDDPHFLQFVKRKNVFMLGWKKYDDLPAYMREMDVFVLPRKHCDWCENSNPNKIYQYLSSGKPLVSSRFSSVEPFEGPIFIADNKETFLKYIITATKEDDEKIRQQRLEIAQQNDLNLRAKEKIEILNNYLANKIG